MADSLSQTVDALKRALPGAAGVDALRTLPRYVVLGSPGVGKTTLLRNSGLKFQYSAPGADGPVVGPTQHCDLWVCPTALFVDVTGKIISHNGTQAEWVAMLDQLGGHLRNGTIHGVVACVAADELARGDASAISTMAR